MTDSIKKYLALILVFILSGLIYWQATKYIYPLYIKKTRPEPEQKTILKTKEPPLIDESFKPILKLIFNENTLKQQWEARSFNGNTIYQIENTNERGGFDYLRAKSADTCSGLYTHIKIPATEGTRIHWTWRARVFPKKNTDNFGARNEDDFAARLYVIFEASNFFKSDIIEYIWDAHLPVGTTADSPFSDRIKLLVVESGLSQVDTADSWREQLRNPLDDYKKLFGRSPKNPMGVVALMTDSDNTNSSAEADFGTIEFFSKE